MYGRDDETGSKFGFRLAIWRNSVVTMEMSVFRAIFLRFWSGMVEVLMVKSL